MIAQLCELGNKLRQEKKGIVHDALKEEPFAIDLVINETGEFQSFVLFEKRMTTAEALPSKKGKARLLVDKAEEVLCLGGDTKKHELFLAKLEEYKGLEELKPVFEFYSSKSALELAARNFVKVIPEKERANNIAFRIVDEKTRIHEKKRVYEAIIKKYVDWEQAELKEYKTTCAVCGKAEHPVLDRPHGLIKRVPNGQTAGCALVSYNENAFESYKQKGNLNSSICMRCAKTYVESLNWLLGNGKKIITKKGGNGFEYSNRKKLSNDTAIIFWTRNNQSIKELELIDKKNEFDLLDPFNNVKNDGKQRAAIGDVKEMFNSLYTGKDKAVKNLENDQFYALILSSAAARIAIRSWIELTLHEMQNNIEKWLIDISIIKFEKPVVKRVFNPIQSLANSCAVHRKNDKGVFSCDYKDTIIGIFSNNLWKSALQNTTVPFHILDKVLQRIKTEQGRITDSRAALIKLILNRNNKGDLMIKEELDMKNESTAYVCGRIFSVLESIQRAALGKNINAGIRERFFSSASTTPSLAFGRLMKMSQNHLSKIKNNKPGFAIFLDKQLQELFSSIEVLPTIFSLEEQGQFAIGYYHQKQDNFIKAVDKEELKSMIEGEEENE
jgi:CRISPR-associated protein Csd1